MKRFVASLFAVGLLGLSAVMPVQAESWYYVGPDNQGRAGYIDNDSVEKDDHQATLRLKVMDPDGQHTVFTIFINKDQNTMQPMNLVAYNAAGYAVDSYTYPSNSVVTIQPGSNLETIKHLIW